MRSAPILERSRQKADGLSTVGFNLIAAPDDGRTPKEWTMLYPLTFTPIFKERVWGGCKLEKLYHKKLPPGAVIGESWEVSDRPGDVSLVANGPLKGKDLHWLLKHHGSE